MKTLFFVVLVCGVSAQVNHLDDTKLDFKGLAVKYGQEAEEFDVVTEDGYILKLFHIGGDKRRPVLFVHGLMDSSDGVIIRGNLSLVINLARAGYDVWAINHRGNRYSRRHLTLNPDRDPQFWNFYVLEYGSKDLPATIDFIIEKTGSKVSIIGNSEGSTTTLVLGATRPEYNDKVRVFIGMAPIWFLEHTRSYVNTLKKISADINKGLKRSRTEEVLGFHSAIKAFIEAFCNIKGVGYMLCMRLNIFQLVGEDPEQFEPEFLPTWLAHFPAGSSRRNMYHFAQAATRKKIAYYDYGAKKNLEKYGSKEPPEYDLNKVTMKVALFAGKNDPVSTLEDVALLSKRLPNLVEYRVMEYPYFSHLDFVWGKVTYTEVLPRVLKILAKYG